MEQSLFLELYEDDQGAFHYQAYQPGVKNARSGPMLCGLMRDDFNSLRKAAWFDVGDSRGAVHYERACPECFDQLVT